MPEGSLGWESEAKKRVTFRTTQRKERGEKWGEKWRLGASIEMSQLLHNQRNIFILDLLVCKFLKDLF